jgi:Immunity protein 8
MAAHTASLSVTALEGPESAFGDGPGELSQNRTMPAEVVAEVKEILAFGAGASPNNALEGFKPPDPGHFGVNLQVLIGEATGDRYDSFDVRVCTPSWMVEQVNAGHWELFRGGGLRALPDSVVPGAGVWFMSHWSEQDIRDAIHVICEAFSPGPDWGSVASRIGRLIPWEFDYKFDAHVDQHFGEVFPPIP